MRRIRPVLELLQVRPPVGIVVAHTGLRQPSEVLLFPPVRQTVPITVHISDVVQLIDFVGGQRTVIDAHFIDLSLDVGSFTDSLQVVVSNAERRRI